MSGHIADVLVLKPPVCVCAAGGYTTGRAEVVGLLRQKARPYLFSNTLAPAVAAASITVFDLLSASHELRDKLQDNTDYFRQHMAAAGFDIRPGNHPIVVRSQLSKPGSARLGVSLL
jgi:7-keto-8-aminopelargonate synthetase-like enzyme